MSGDIIIYAYAGSIILSAGSIIIALRYKTLGRILFSLLFLWAGFYNLHTAFIRPQEYLGFAHFAYSDWYQSFITGFFSHHITLIITAIAIGQIAIAILIALRGRAVILGLAGAVIFLVAITPLGIGSAFPSTILMSIAAILLLRINYPRSLTEQVFMFFRDKL